MNPETPTPPNPPEAEFTLADFDTLRAACAEEFPVHLAVGGELVPGPNGDLIRRHEKRLKVMVRRLTSEEAAYCAELMREAVPEKIRDPHTQEERYNLDAPEFLAKRRTLESLVRAYVLIRCVPEFEKGWSAYRLKTGGDNPKLGKKLSQQRALVTLQAAWLNENFPDDVLEKLRAAAESDVVDERKLADFFTTGN